MSHTMPKTKFSNYLNWNPNSDTILAISAGVLTVLLSFAMIITRNITWLNIAIRDIAQIFLLGIFLPLIFILRSHENWATFGFTLRKWPIYLIINLVLGSLLLLLFLSESPPEHNFHVTSYMLKSAAFVIIALIFELVFFYAFLRTLLEKAFGIIPSIILTAMFYAFHHAGFQPEFGKLFFVGLIYALTFRLGNSALLIFPFFLGVGGLYDVFIQSQVVAPVQFPLIRTGYLILLISVTIVYIFKKKHT